MTAYDIIGLQVNAAVDGFQEIVNSPVEFNVKWFGSALTDVPIRAALAALPSTGGTIYIPEGTYVLSQNIAVIDKSNVRIRGAGRGKTILSIASALSHPSMGIGGAGSSWGAISVDSSQVGVRVSNVTISGLSINAAAVNYNDNQKLIYIGLVDGITIEDCRFSSNSREWLFMNCATNGNGGTPPINIRVLNNQFTGDGTSNTSGECVSLQTNGSVSLEQIHNVLIQGNFFVSCIGLYIHAGANNMIVGYNSSVSCGQMMLGADGEVNLFGMVAIGNVVNRPTGGGYAIKVNSDLAAGSSSGGNLITGNIVTDLVSGSSAAFAIGMEGNGTISNNIIRGCLNSQSATNSSAIGVSTPNSWSGTEAMIVHLINNRVEDTTNTYRWAEGVTIFNSTSYGDKLTVILSDNYIGDITAGQYALSVANNGSGLYPNVYYSNDIFNAQVLLRKGRFSGNINSGNPIPNIRWTGNNVTVVSATFVDPVTSQSYMKVGSYAVADLTTAATAGLGAIAAVTDSLTPTIGSNVSAGGSAKCLVCSNGTNWKVTSVL